MTRSPRRRTAAVLASLVIAGGLGTAASASAADPVEPLARDCSQSELDTHNGFQEAPRCVETAFGEVSAQANNPTLLITDSPRQVRPGQDITLQISIRNLIRDRFLAAGQGGYYLESATLRDGITRGHAHGACELVGDAAPQPERTTNFQAVEDGEGGAGADSVTLTLDGLNSTGEARCAVWAGDGSHRIPMMQFANQVPAFDVVRVRIQGAPIREDGNVQAARTTARARPSTRATGSGRSDGRRVPRDDRRQGRRADRDLHGAALDGRGRRPGRPRPRPQRRDRCPDLAPAAGHPMSDSSPSP